MRVLVDLDGVICDFDGYFFVRCAEEGFFIPIQRHEQTYRWANDHMPDPAHRKASRLMIERDLDWFINLPVMPGALEGFAKLIEKAEVWLCTKPLEANPRCRDAKAQWVERHLGEKWMRRLIITPDKSLVDADLLLDDAPKLHWLPVARWKAVVYRAPYNGPDSEWGELPHWDWSEPIDDLLEYARHEFLPVN